jgi:microcystin degradation protein MlrC
VAELKQETNTFVPTATTMVDFENWHLWRGADAAAGLADSNSEFAGFLDVLGEAGIEPVPILATFAISGGPVAAATLARLRDDLLSGIAAAGPLDGVLLALHGAMVAEDEDDPDGATIALVRAAVGPETPLVVSMDLHANVTPRCVEGADALVGFRTSPHIDQRDTGQRAARILVRMLNEGVRPAMAIARLPMVVPASTHMHHLPGPFQRLMQAAEAAETGSVLAAAVFTVQPWLDLPDLGCSVVVVTDGDRGLAEREALRLAELAWAERDAFMELQLVDPAKAIRRALARKDGPVVLSDLADGTGAGSPGDATAVVAALLTADPPAPAFACIRDPAAAQQAIEAGLGAEVNLEAGGKLDHVYNRPVRLRGTVTFAGPARFRFAGGGYTGIEMDMGDCAVVRRGQVSVLLLGKSVMTVDPAMYRAVGLEPGAARIVVVKSHIQFRAGYDGIAREIILLDSPGMSSDHLEALPFRRLPRPFFPFDRDFSPTLTATSRGGAATGVA